ncbi:hypothetical protein [Neopusillimonas aromaticivorans]|uniref:hypothetical protein n=1 Tax=Neopusillimonas aromaticivorans TaxID=2979868 RepID=UPI00259977A0|nr:hypothetical protein [Neopusillimonas aromaticivorans]WJJ93419.1 hypothetical protein N7E01_15875 [Neopusillimonas aromaticivorans]
MSKATFHVLYDGPALANHEMNVRDLAPALLALGQVLEEANAAINDGRAQVSVQVKASFKTGCFGIELDVTQSLIQQIHLAFSSENVANAKNLLEWIGLISGATAFTGATINNLFRFLKWLKNRKINKVVLLDNGNVRVVLDDEAVDVEAKVIALFRQARLRKALEDVLKPVEREGIDEFAVTNQQQSERFFTISKHELRYFSAPDEQPEMLAEDEVEMNLQLVNVAFREDNKWRFSDGNSTFYAQVEDVDFLNKVQSNEPFARGDILKARLRRVQSLSGETMKTEYIVLKVQEHRRAGVQLPMTFEHE